MKAEIYSNTELIGIVELQLTDESMGVVSGKFNPSNHYHQIRKVIWDFHHKQSEANYIAIERLRLNAKLANGYFLFPLGGFLISDIMELPDEEIEFEAAGVFRHIIKDNFISNPPKERIFEPWEFLSIGQKIAFEDELKKEIGKGLDNATQDSNEHIRHKLGELEFCVIATSCRNDDVLFAINKKGKNEYDYAVIHLTWKGQLERNEDYPRTQFYEDFDHFLYYKLYPDKSDWED